MPIDALPDLPALNLWEGLPLDFVLAASKLLNAPPQVFTPEDLVTLRRFVEVAGIRPEGTRPFDLNEIKYQIPLYEEARADWFPRVVIQKAAQTGLTIRMLNRAMWWCADAEEQVNSALMFPTRDAVQELSVSRFRPMLRSSARMVELVQEADRADLVRIGVSNMRFRGMRSGVSVDSFPADYLGFDEVRLMSIQMIERAFVRISASTKIHPRTGHKGIIDLNSTAGFPDMDINRWFERHSTRGYWATQCPDAGCPSHKSGIILPLEFAERFERVIGQDAQGWYYYRCPSCGARISDTEVQTGWYHHERPGAEWTGYQFSQLLKGEEWLNRELMPAFLRGDNMPEFYNARLGLPYEDRDAVVASRAVVEACMDPSLQYRFPPAPLGFNGEYRVAGVDQGETQQHLVIKTLLPDGRHRLDHLEVIEAADIKAAAMIVRACIQWGVQCLVMDARPALHLLNMVARELPKGVTWMAEYEDSPHGDPIRWLDKRDDEAIRKSEGDVKYEYRAKINRTKAMRWSMQLFKFGRNLLPTRASFMELKQLRKLPDHDQRITVQIGEEFVSHLGNIAFIKMNKQQTLPTGEKVDIPGEYRETFRFLRIDPHFAHANLYADVALARRKGTTQLHDMNPAPTPPKTSVDAALPHALRPSTIAQQQRDAVSRTCGGCRFFKAAEGHCGHPNAHAVIRVKPETPACEDYRKQRTARVDKLEKFNAVLTGDARLVELDGKVYAMPSDQHGAMGGDED